MVAPIEGFCRQRKFTWLQNYITEWRKYKMAIQKTNWIGTTKISQKCRCWLGMEEHQNFKFRRRRTNFEKAREGKKKLEVRNDEVKLASKQEICVLMVRRQAKAIESEIRYISVKAPSSKEKSERHRAFWDQLLSLLEPDIFKINRTHLSY